MFCPMEKPFFETLPISVDKSCVLLPWFQWDIERLEKVQKKKRFTKMILKIKYMAYPDRIKSLRLD